MCLQEFPVRSSDTASAVTRQIQLASASSAARRGSEYAELSRQVKDAGLLERRPGYYAWKIAVTIGLLAAGWTVFVVAGHSWGPLAGARVPAGGFSPIRSPRRRFWERALITVHAAGYLAVVFLVLPPVRAVVFMIVQQGLFGLYLGCSFAPNHKGMPILDAADRCDFLRRQALTSRNVRGGWLTDFALGGLNYQIEHHLFPSMPRPNLRRSQALIEAFCRQRGVPYCQSSLAGSYAQALRHLHAVGRPARPAEAA